MSCTFMLTVLLLVAVVIWVTKLWMGERGKRIGHAVIHEILSERLRRTRLSGNLEGDGGLQQTLSAYNRFQTRHRHAVHVGGGGLGDGLEGLGGHVLTAPLDRVLDDGGEAGDAVILDEDLIKGGVRHFTVYILGKIFFSGRGGDIL